MGHAVEAAVGGVAACHHMRPDVLPPMRHLRDALRISDRSRGVPPEALTRRHGPVAPGDIAARAYIGHPLDPRLAPKPGGEKRNRHQVPHALIAQDGRFPVAQARGPMVPDLPPPWLALRQHRTAHTNTGLDRQPQTRRRASALTATDDRDLRARLADG